MSQALPLVAYPDLAGRVKAMQRDGSVYLPIVAVLFVMTFACTPLGRAERKHNIARLHHSPEQG
jgi:hypothetical protein